jgi:transcriptional regulator with XRE-family HTH domain
LTPDDIVPIMGYTRGPGTGRRGGRSVVVADGFIAALLRHQGTASDLEFATRLGISRPQLSHLRHGKRKPSVAFTKRAIRLYPDLGAHWLRETLEGPDDKPAERVA